MEKVEEMKYLKYLFEAFIIHVTAVILNIAYTTWN